MSPPPSSHVASIFNSGRVSGCIVRSICVHPFVVIFFYRGFDGGYLVGCVEQAGKDGKLEKFEIPAKIKLLHEPWTPETNLVTAAMKLKRENVRKTFADDLKALYS